MVVIWINRSHFWEYRDGKCRQYVYISWTESEIVRKMLPIFTDLKYELCTYLQGVSFKTEFKLTIKQWCYCWWPLCLLKGQSTLLRKWRNKSVALISPSKYWPTPECWNCALTPTSIQSSTQNNPKSILFQNRMSVNIMLKRHAKPAKMYIVESCFRAVYSENCCQSLMQTCRAELELCLHVTS